MFRIESYISSMILANADRYIKNFRKEDAQVSLWEGDATFYNIDLNVNALNEEFNSLFVFTSGFIRDLNIHVPWTKLTSEPVTISVNTIECVMRLKTKDEKMLPMTKKQDRSTEEYSFSEKRSLNEDSPLSSSYSSTLTAKIMNNVSIRCENIILKLVEEDIVFSMNIEKLNFENVDENWAQAITDVNTDKFLTRKALTLSGVTICLDKQNSSGRIDMYLEPLLYRCLINVRILRGYNRTVSKKPIYTHIDILSNKMSFTICEPQLPMLLKLGLLIFYNNSTHHSKDIDDDLNSIENSTTISNENTSSNVDINEYKDETWSNWLWNMMPSILSQENDSLLHSQKKLSATFHLGFCVTDLEIYLKVFDSKSKKQLRKDFKHFLRSRYLGCVYQMTTKNEEWLNCQLGVSHVSVEMFSNENNGDNQTNVIFSAGHDNRTNYTNETLFNEKFDFFSFKMHQKLSYETAGVTDDVPQAFEYSNYDFIYNVEFSIDTHLNLCTENQLLEKTPAFAIDYVKVDFSKNSTSIMNEGNDKYSNESFDREYIDLDVAESTQKNPNNMILSRFILGSCLLRVSSDAIYRFSYLNKIIPSISDFSSCHPSDDLSSYQRFLSANHSTQFTFFDLVVELHPSPLNHFQSICCRRNSAVEEIPSAVLSTPTLIFRCKCMDGNSKYERCTTFSTEADWNKITKIKAVDISVSLVQPNRSHRLLKLDKFDGERIKKYHSKCEEIRVEATNFKFSFSKPDLSLVQNTINYLVSFARQSENKSRYYANIYCTSLIEDTFALNSDNVSVLEIKINTVEIKYKLIGSSFGVRTRLHHCRAFATTRLVVDDKISIFSTENDGSSVMEVMFQYGCKSDENHQYPSCIWFNFSRLKLNLDASIYPWFLYEPIVHERQKYIAKTSKTMKEQNIIKSGPVRKISDTSSGSTSRKYSSYPKPKESVHSSSEPELHSPMDVTETETSDMFQTADDMSVVDEPTDFVQYLADNVLWWRSLIVLGDIASITVYLPADAARINAERSEKSNSGLLKFDLKLLRLKCDAPPAIFADMCSNLMISMVDSAWVAGRQTFPWNISLSDFSVSSITDTHVWKSLLEPLTANCTIGVSSKDREGESVVTLCVHYDFQPIFVGICADQVQLLLRVASMFTNICMRTRNETQSCLATRKKTALGRINENVELEKPSNRFTGWIQWTFTKCSLSLYDGANDEQHRLYVEAEDSIASLEFDEIFHKFKIKIASFGIRHQKRCSTSEPWQCGSYLGVIVRKCYNQPTISSKANEEEAEDRFLLATMTRVRSSSLHSRLASSATSEIGTAVPMTGDLFITEMILKLCPLDVVLPVAVLDRFVSVVKPTIDYCMSGKPASDEMANILVGDSSCISFPLVYFDIPSVRIFAPVSKTNEHREYPRNTFIVEIGSIHVDCHLENPIVRKHANMDAYYSIPGRKYTSMKQKMQHQQYQIHIGDVCVNTGVWSEIERMLIDEQASVEPPSVLEQNPAVMWNQGCHPDEVKNKTRLESSMRIISKVAVLVLVAPPTECSSLKAAIQGGYFEADILTDTSITICVDELPLMADFWKEWMNYANSYSEKEEQEMMESIGTASKSSGVISARAFDSGVESMEYSSTSSSTISKMRNSHKSASESTNPSGRSTGGRLLPKAAFKKQFSSEVYLTAQSLTFTLYTIVNKSANNEKTKYGGLFFVEAKQPYALINKENNHYSLQCGIFNVGAYVSTAWNFETPTEEIPNDGQFYTKFAYVKSSRCDPYTKIIHDCFTLKMNTNLNGKWRIDCTIQQQLFVDCDVDIIRGLKSTSAIFGSKYGNECMSESKKTKETESINSARTRLGSISVVNIYTDRIFAIFKNQNKTVNAFVIVDSLKMELKTPHNLKSCSETLTNRCDFRSVVISLPETCDLLTGDIPVTMWFIDNRRLMSGLMLGPWSFTVELSLTWQRWNLCEDRPWKRVKLTSDSLILNVNPSYLEKMTDVAANYASLTTAFGTDKNDEAPQTWPDFGDDGNVEYYKDDLRAGAFQYMKRETEGYKSLSAYEVVFCNRRRRPYICWRYPQPRGLTKLQIYPVPLEDTNDDRIEHVIGCQLQYYDENENVFRTYVYFNLSENAIQNVTLPQRKPRIVAAECWRIVLDETNSADGYDLKMDIKLLAGCVRVDSIFQPCLVPNLQATAYAVEVRVNFSTINEGNEHERVEYYTMFSVPQERQFASLVLNDMKGYFADYSSDKILKLSSVVRANIMNYEYAMLQSFVDPVFVETILHVDRNSEWKLATMTKNVHVRVSPRFVHTLTVAKYLWNGWRDSESAWRVVASYVVCNNTDYKICFHQENTAEADRLYLPPLYCYSYAWYNPKAAKNLIVTLLASEKKYVSGPLNIKKVGCEPISCISEDGDSRVIFVSVLKPSSIAYQIVIRGNFLIYNLTSSQMDLCVVSYGREEAKNKLSSANIITRTSFAKNQFTSVTLPLDHKLSFKVRFSDASNGDIEQGHWSGLIPLVATQKRRNQTSWMVKIPLKNHREHFQSLWCQLMWEVVEGSARYLVVFRPMCTVRSFLPWKFRTKIINDVGSLVNECWVEGRSERTDLFVPDTVSLDKYTLEMMANENCEKVLTRVKLEKQTRRREKSAAAEEVNVQDLINDLTNDLTGNKWPFLKGAFCTSTFGWKPEQIYDIEPKVKVYRNEDQGGGTTIEIYPKVIVANSFGYSLVLSIAEVNYTVERYEVIAPPCTESTFKLGLVDETGHCYLSGVLQLSDDQSFPIPKITGRIPMNGSVTTMIDCDTYASFLNITSKNHEEMRIINVCSSYVISNNTKMKIGCSAWVVCRCGNKSPAPYDIPSSLKEHSIELRPNENNSTRGFSLVKWYKIGTGDVQVLPYLILDLDGNVGCPIRICDLSETQRYPILFSSIKSHPRLGELPRVFMTAQQADGQVFLTIWEEKCPQVTIHNMSGLSLNVISSKSEKGNEGVSYCTDWNWKFVVAAESSAHCHVRKQISQKNEKRQNEYLIFAIQSDNVSKKTKWSSGVLLRPSRNLLVTLPLSQHHIKLAIYRDGFTYVVWIESATADELSAKTIRSRLSESFLPLDKDGSATLTVIQDDTNADVDTSSEIPGPLKKLYECDTRKFSNLIVFVKEFAVTLTCDDETTYEENDVATFRAKNIVASFDSCRKPNEVTENTSCSIGISSYQIDNDEYHSRSFDFPVLLYSHTKERRDEDVAAKIVLEDLLLSGQELHNVSLKVTLGFHILKSFDIDIRDIELLISPQNVYLEDKYLTKLRSSFEGIFSATEDAFGPTNDWNRNRSGLRIPYCSGTDIVTSPTTDHSKEINAKRSPAKVKSSSSKSVNLSDYDTDDRNSFVSAESETKTKEEDYRKPMIERRSANRSQDALRSSYEAENRNYCDIPAFVMQRANRIAKPLRLRSVHISGFSVTVSVRTSTTFYIALDRSPLNFSEFRKEYVITTPFELGNLLVVHYFMGAVYGTGWAIGSLEFVGSPSILARDLGTGIKDFVSMPLYGIASGPRGFVLGMAHGSASLLKHIMTGTLTSVTNFAGSWARTLNRITLDPEDLLLSEQITRIPPNNIAEGMLQGLSEFGISLLGGISGIAHHPLQYATSNAGDRSLINSISLGIMGVLTRPLSGAAELVARTGQGILSHIGWNGIPVRGEYRKAHDFSILHINNLKFNWNRDFHNVVLTFEAVREENTTIPLWMVLTCDQLHAIETTSTGQHYIFNVASYEFTQNDDDTTLIIVQEPFFNYDSAEEFSKTRILKFITDTNCCLNIDSMHTKENLKFSERLKTVFKFNISPDVRNLFLNTISFLKNTSDSKSKPFSFSCIPNTEGSTRL